MSSSRLKAGALQLVLFIAVVIALILSAFILLIYSHNLFELKSSKSIGLMRINGNALVNYPETDGEHTKFKSEYWGLLKMITAESSQGGQSMKRSAFIGHRFMDNQTGLVLKDNNKPLVVVGNTIIEGDARLPEKGVKAGQIAGIHYYGSTLINGHIFRSDRFPVLNEDFLSYLENPIAGYETLIPGSLHLNTTLTNSFHNAPLYIQSDETIELFNKEIRGNIIIHSGIDIIIDESSSLSDVLLIAPKITIKSRVKGNFQAIASELITVGENAHLSYPTGLAVVSKLKDQGQLLIDKNSRIDGTVVFNGIVSKQVSEAQLSIAEDSEINGQVYCNQYLELKGAVNGQVITNNFISRYKGSVYHNHLMDGKILRSELPNEFVGMPMGMSDPGIAKWLY